MIPWCAPGSEPTPTPSTTLSRCCSRSGWPCWGGGWPAVRRPDQPPGKEPRPVSESVRREPGGAPAHGRMDIEPVRSTRIYEEIVRQVKQLIGEGRLKSGDRLPPERDLAEKFRVSRTSVREALRALQSRGLIEIRAGGGAFIPDVPGGALIGALALASPPHRHG